MNRIAAMAKIVKQSVYDEQFKTKCELWTCSKYSTSFRRNCRSRPTARVQHYCLPEKDELKTREFFSKHVYPFTYVTTDKSGFYTLRKFKSDEQLKREGHDMTQCRW